MGASSSSAFWEHAYLYPHDQKKLTCLYETEISNIRFVKDQELTIQEANEVMKKKGMFSDINLVLDIDLTLGEAIIVSKDSKFPHKLNLNQKPVDLYVIERLQKLGKVEIFHQGSCCFFIRPYFREFVQFCVNNFQEVVIWTNGIQQHADDMTNLIYKITGKQLRGFSREQSSGCNQIKIISSIGLDPKKTWMVDDDHRHHRRTGDNDVTKDVNPEIKFFHTPEFSVSWFENFFEYHIYQWHNNEKMLDLYDDWFLFLVWNWNYMKENKIELKSFVRKDNKFVHN